MYIQKIADYKLFSFFKSNDSVKNQRSIYGLNISEPIGVDTVSFKQSKATKAAKAIKSAVVEGKRSNKDVGDEKITIDMARCLIKALEKPHGDNVKKFMYYFGGIMSDTDRNKNIIRRGLVTFIERIKREYSLSQKVSSVAADEDIPIDKINKKTLLKYVTDISGMGVILEEIPPNLKRKKIKNSSNYALSETTKIILKMIKEGAIKVEEIEYHRRSPERDKDGNVIKSFDPMDSNVIKKFMADAQDIINSKDPQNDRKIGKVVYNPIGYSAVHIKINNGDGTYTEFKILTRAMVNIQDIENQFYKTEHGKTVAPEYEKEIGEYLASLKPLSPFATQEEIDIYSKILKALKEYKKTVYELAIDNPYYDIQEFPEPKNPLIKQYGFNLIRDKMARCKENKKAKTKKN